MRKGRFSGLKTIYIFLTIHFDYIHVIHFLKAVWPRKIVALNKWCWAYLGRNGLIRGHILGEITDLEFGTHGFLMNHVFLPNEQVETNICWKIYQDANFKICLSLFGWKENILPKEHIVQWRNQWWNNIATLNNAQSTCKQDRHETPPCPSFTI